MATLTKTDVRKAAETHLEKAVARWIIQQMPDYNNDPTGPLKDLFYGGCSSGVVGNLIYYRDTVAFHNHYAADIWEIAITQADDAGETNAFALLAQCPGAADAGNADQVMNFLAWFGFEEAARTIAGRLRYDD